MRFNELNESELLSEVAMSPTALKKAVANIDAKVGIEFEMIVPNAEGGDDGDMEPDYDENRSARDIDDICEFFEDGDYNSRQDVRRLREKLEEEYFEWRSEQLYDQWQREGKDFLRDYFVNNNEFDEDEEFDNVMDEMELDDDVRRQVVELDRNPGSNAPQEIYDTWQKVQRAVNNKLEEKVEESWSSEDRDYDYAKEEFEELEGDNYSDSDWVDDNYPSMVDVERGFDISWPYWRYESGETSIEEVADSFADAVGKKVRSSSSYHGTRRDTSSYVVEPDSSLEGDSGDAGLEFVSPPMSLTDMLHDMEAIRGWADSYGCYTNESCGLHMNVSVPNIEQLDYVKLALFLGDNYVLEQFDRVGNTYAKSVVNSLKAKVKESPESAKVAMSKMKDHLGVLASKIIHDGQTSKYVTINNHNGYIEFRSPGGDWLGAETEKLENTLMRFIVALDIACDPEKEKQEYAKKLYKLLAAHDDNMSTMTYFAQYAAGKLPRSALVSFVRNIRNKKKEEKTRDEQAKTKFANAAVYKIDNGNIPYQVLDAFTNEVKAVAFAGGRSLVQQLVKRELNLDPSTVYISMVDSREVSYIPSDNVKQVSESDWVLADLNTDPDAAGWPEFKLYKVTTGEIAQTFRAPDRSAATTAALNWLRSNNISPEGWQVHLLHDEQADQAAQQRQVSPPPAPHQELSGAPQSSEPEYAIVHRRTGETIQRFYAPSVQAAQQEFNRITQNDPVNFGLHPVLD